MLTAGWLLVGVGTVWCLAARTARRRASNERSPDDVVARIMYDFRAGRLRWDSLLGRVAVLSGVVLLVVHQLTS